MKILVVDHDDFHRVLARHGLQMKAEDLEPIVSSETVQTRIREVAVTPSSTPHVFRVNLDLMEEEILKILTDRGIIKMSSGQLTKRIATEEQWPIIKAEAHSEDFSHKAIFDAVSYFRTASEVEIFELAAWNWGNNPAAMQIMRVVAEEDVDVAKVLAYADSGLPVVCNIKSQDAVRWIADNRPEVYEALKKEGLL